MADNGSQTAVNGPEENVLSVAVDHNLNVGLLGIHDTKYCTKHLLAKKYIQGVS